MQNGTLLAAIDLGSNSFRLEIGRYHSGHIERIEYLKETVRQGNGLDEEKNLSPAAMERGWECLARFGERLHGFRKQQVRAVATQTLREARNRDEFLRQVSRRMVRCVREPDLVARLAGDEFAILLVDIATADVAVRVAHADVGELVPDDRAELVHGEQVCQRAMK